MIKNRNMRIQQVLKSILVLVYILFHNLEKGEAIPSHEKIVGSSENHCDHGVSMFNGIVIMFYMI